MRLLPLLVLVMITLSGCGRRAAAAPTGIATSVISKSTIDALIESAEPNSVVWGGMTGGGGFGTRDTILGPKAQGAFNYQYTCHISTAKGLDPLLDALRTGLKSKIQSAGATILRSRAKPTVADRRQGEPMRTIRTTESLQYKLNGLQGDVFLVAYPISDRQATHELIIRVVEILADG